MSPSAGAARPDDVRPSADPAHPDDVRPSAAGAARPDDARPGDVGAAGRVPEDPYASDPARPLTSALRPWWRWLFLLPGLAAVAYGAQGLLTAGGRVPLGSWLTWFVGSALVHDLVIAPLWIGLGWLAARLLPRAARPAAAVAAAVSGVLALVALPFVLGLGADPANPSFLPREYGRNLLLLVAAVWLAAAVRVAIAVHRARRPAA